MDPSRLRDRPSQADIPADIKDQAETRLRSFQHLCETTQSTVSTIIERVNSYEVQQAFEGIKFFNQASSDFTAAKNKLHTAYHQLDSWMNVTCRDRSWGHQLLDLFDHPKSAYKSTSEAMAKIWNTVFQDLARRCICRMSLDELRDFHARLQAELRRRRVQHVSEDQTLADMLRTMDIGAAGHK
ncbi:hypothetical protein BR93DRAFT_965247 [Coniochaeta sp. PMI_546]|nr:hypothetical protein BR93DRAFT_965247 [Coniochaeta sp. PMI_546]